MPDENSNQKRDQEEGESRPDLEEELDQMTDHSPITMTVTESSSSVHIVKVESNSLREAFESLGGWGSSTGGEGSRLEIQIRGGAGQQSGLYIDDIALHSLRSKAVDLNLFAIDLLERVELKLGGDGASQGSGSMAGSLHLSTPQIEGSDSRQRIKFDASTQGFGRISALIQPKEIGGLRSLFACSLGGGPNRFTYIDRYAWLKRREHASFQQYNGLLKLEFERSDWELKLSLGAGQLARDEPGPETFSLPGRQSDQSVFWISLSQQSPLWLIGKAHVFLTLRQSLLSLGYYFEELNPLWQSQESAVSDFKDRRGLVSAELVGNWSRLKLSLLSELSETFAKVTSQSVERTQAAVTPQVDWRLSPHLTWTFAYRADFNSERSPQFIPTTSFSLQSGSVRPWRAWFTASLVWRDPGFDERFLTGPGLIPNPDLTPEHGRWAEVGLKKSLRLSLGSHELRAMSSIRLFTQRYQEMITFVPLDPYRIRAENVGDSQISGSEFNIRLSDSFGRLRAQFELQASALDHQTLHSPKAPLPLRPSFFGYGRSALIWNLIDGRLEGWMSVSARDKVSVDRFGERTLPTRGILSLGVLRSWQWNYRWQLATKVTNLNHTSSYDFALYPIPGRSFWVSLSVQ